MGINAGRVSLRRDGGRHENFPQGKVEVHRDTIQDPATMKTICSALALLLVATFTANSADEKIKVLLITGDDVASHKWQETCPVTRDILVKSQKFDVKVVEDLSPLEKAEELASYDLIFLHRYDRAGVISDQAKENLLNFVKGGKGFAVSHLASASFGPKVKKDGDRIEVEKPGWDEFNKLCGRCWVMKVSGHGPRAPFQVKITGKDDPITQGIEDFEADDELYANLQGDTEIKVLATSDSDWSKKTEPMVFTLNYGKGRVFHETFGHDPKALDNPSIAKIICRGCEWAATGKVE